MTGFYFPATFGKGYKRQQRCSEASSDTSVEVDPTDTIVQCNDYTQSTNACPDGYVITKTCNNVFGNYQEAPACNFDICSGSGGREIVSGIECMRVIGYEYKGTLSNVANSMSSTYSVESCKKSTQDVPVDTAYSVSNQVTTTSAVTTTTTSSAEAGTSITDKLQTSSSIAGEVGLPKGKIVAKTEAGTEHAVETSFVTSRSYINEQYDAVTRQDTIKREMALTGGRTWSVLSWGAEVNGVGDYVVAY